MTLLDCFYYRKWRKWKWTSFCDSPLTMWIRFEFRVFCRRESFDNLLAFTRFPHQHHRWTTPINRTKIILVIRFSFTLSVVKNFSTLESQRCGNFIEEKRPLFSIIIQTFPSFENFYEFLQFPYMMHGDDVERVRNFKGRNFVLCLFSVAFGGFYCDVVQQQPIAYFPLCRIFFLLPCAFPWLTSSSYGNELEGFA